MTRKQNKDLDTTQDVRVKEVKEILESSMSLETYFCEGTFSWSRRKDDIFMGEIGSMGLIMTFYVHIFFRIGAKFAKFAKIMNLEDNLISLRYYKLRVILMQSKR